MKILTLDGSPKPAGKSDTFRLSSRFLAGLMKQDGMTNETIRLIDKNIKPCIGCFQCWHRKDGTCIIEDDDQNELLAKFRDADIVLLSFPLYFYSIPSHVKAFLDRTLPLHQSQMVQEGNRIAFQPIEGLKHTKFVIISGCGFPQWDGNFTALDIICKNAFGPDSTRIFVSETPMLHQEAAKPVTEPLLQKFEAAGEEFAKNGCLSDATLKSLTTPMLPEKDYMDYANARHAKY